VLYGSLFFSFIILVVGMASAREAPHPVRWGLFIPVGLVVSAGSIFFGFLPLPAILLGILLAMGLAWFAARKPRVSFFPISLACVVLAWGIPLLVAFGTVAHYDRLRDKYAFESMEERAPVPIAVGTAGPLPDDVEERLTDFESQVEISEEARLINQWRVRELKQLHEGKVKEFVNSPGFGVGRIHLPSEKALKPWQRAASPEQPEPSFSSQDGPEPELPVDVSPFRGFHSVSMLDFLNPGGFGYLKDRQHAAGFQSHGFSRLPETTTTWPKQEKVWNVQRIELVGLLLSVNPIVYVTNELPAMETVREAPRRPVDRFEANSLARIRAGNDLIGAQSEDQLRLLGAIRSGKQCVECHGGKRGDLLGAFSYTLRRVEAKK